MAFNLDGTIVKELITDLFIPTVRKNLVSGAFLTTKTGIKAESLKIWGVGAVTVGDYVGGDVAGADHVDTSVTLTLDKHKFFKENVERVDSEESAINVLGAILPEGAYGIADAIDKDVFTALTATTNLVTAIALDETNILEWIGSMGTKLTNLGAPKAGRRLAISPEVSALLAIVGLGKGSDTIATEAGKEYFITRFGGFDIYESTNLVDGATTGKFAIATTQRCGALGIGYNELGIEAVSGQFYDCAKGLTAYGVKLSQPKFCVKSDVSLA